MLYKYACKLLLNILFSRPFFVFWSSLTFRGTLSSWISATGKKSRLSGWIKRFYTPQASLCLSVHVNSDVHVTLGLQFDVCGWGVLERGGGGGARERGGHKVIKLAWPFQNYISIHFNAFGNLQEILNSRFPLTS